MSSRKFTAPEPQNVTFSGNRLFATLRNKDEAILEKGGPCIQGQVSTHDGRMETCGEKAKDDRGGDWSHVSNELSNAKGSPPNLGEGFRHL